VGSEKASLDFFMIEEGSDCLFRELRKSKNVEVEYLILKEALQASFQEK
jgi:hypothetical protein